MSEHTPAPTPARSLYGFFMYLFSKTVLCLYFMWAFIPDDIFHYFNIYYYPQKYWATAIPIQCLVALTIFAFLVYPSTNFMLTTNIDDIRTIQDSFTNNTCSAIEDKTSSNCICCNVSTCKYNCMPLYNNLEQNIVPQLCDLDIRVICKKLYNQKQVQVKRSIAAI
ncbi:phosphatidylinositol N-acetylglucosaminyltransferase subunit P [Manduca sexta]|uniref:PIG-P domain-containing protein n=1 Tax=Manduca sexta TaxID=7130 RepID=A0A921ZJ51_MANSE|nr:phosphatidylinositol N-acetylglucosaminyltransferase subunit P [Manduca sexta]XP_030032635.1 phosphatidylinositol N-acetylglucosaminyltransferase subunit P [Manduca sexta]XP_030032636.1 phosphatidylinositol N-acetylglucosaminyltransferase subunit P [Manduca sexta]XP_030032637.1 phosphatidylinositol N-acetylglucosaminyltransferase subunit P [Manduca sexta]KAG6458787.1 hypothetical protein O3G_MSEX011056 [Manduca sexta]KAG6458788.1 hypothetical protein O3G_MSEX011056 [Manduca sexta]KAG645878